MKKKILVIKIMMEILKFEIMKVMRAKSAMMGVKNKLRMMRMNLEIKRMMNKGKTFSKVTLMSHI